MPFGEGRFRPRSREHQDLQDWCRSSRPDATCPTTTCGIPAVATSCPRWGTAGQARLTGPLPGIETSGLVRIQASGHSTARRRAHIRGRVMRCETDTVPVQAAQIRQNVGQFLNVREPLRGPHLIHHDHQDVRLVPVRPGRTVAPRRTEEFIPPKPTAAAPAAIAPVVSTVLRLSSAMDST